MSFGLDNKNVFRQPWSNSRGKFLRHAWLSVWVSGLISERYVAELMNEIAKIRSICGDLISYDWISVPLIYSQLVTLAVYSYFAAALFGRYLNHNSTISNPPPLRMWKVSHKIAVSLQTTFGQNTRVRGYGASGFVGAIILDPRVLLLCRLVEGNNSHSHFSRH